MQQETLFLLGIVRYLLNNRMVELPQPHPDMDWNKLYKLAERHSIINLVFYGEEYLPEELRPSEFDRDYLYKCASREMIRSYRQTEAAETILDAFEKAGINVLAVKGTRTKRHYPEPDMRTMGDIDLLYRTTHDVKVKQIMEELEYECNFEGRKHDLYRKKPYVGVEMHRELVAPDSEYGFYYENIWDRLTVRENCKYIHEMSIEDEYIYTIVHLVEHFKHGGIGIRFVMDVYVYSGVEGLDWKYIEEELKGLKLWEFHNNIQQLAFMWFGVKPIGENTSETLKELSDYIITSGTFGTAQNAAAVSVAKEGRFLFLWKTIFPNLHNMQSMFPWLKKYPILLPYSWVLRGVRSMLYRRQNIKGQFAKYRDGDVEHGQELEKFFAECGL